MERDFFLQREIQIFRKQKKIGHCMNKDRKIKGNSKKTEYYTDFLV